MEGLLLQDWITIRGTNDTTKVAQGSSRWVDLGDIEDLVIFLDVRAVTSPMRMSYETSPTKQDGSFVAMVPAFTVSAIGQRVDRVFTSTSAVPPARYVRWKLANGGPGWALTFRIWLGAYAWVRG